MDRDERDARDQFRERYRAPREEVNRRIERSVLGSDVGANGYTTRSQADRLVELLDLSPQKRLLDLGAGRGWPGLHLGERSGCEVVLTDLVPEGLAQAVLRADADGTDRVRAVASGGRHLPFRARVFDAVVHTDVIC